MTAVFPGGLTLYNKIGQGVSGEVFEGADPVHGRVAVKIYSKDSTEDDAAWADRKASLLHEGQRLKEAEHANVVRVFQMVGTADGSAVGLVMELCERGSLKTAYDFGPMTLKDLRTILTYAALGLHGIHQRGMLHRDLKPSNIMIGNDRRAKIADFGLVTENLVLGYASLAGYTDHLAPEVFRTRKMSVKTDIWAFGMTTYRLLHGREFYQESPRPATAVAAGGFAQKLPWLPHVPDPWRRFVRKAMHDDSSKRFQSATDVLCGLESLPIDPEWSCLYAPDRSIWQRVKGRSLILIECQKEVCGQYEWRATSKNLDSGKSRKLSGSVGKITKKAAHDGMTTFFAGAK